MTSPASNPLPSVPVPEPDWSYLVEHGLDRATLELHFPLGADWHTLRACAHPACDRPADKYPWLCWQCCSAWRKAGSPGDVASWCAAAPAPPARRVYGEKRCAVACPRPAEASGLCKSCASARKATGLSVEEYLATGPAPRPGLGECVVRVCSRWAVQKGRRLCLPHQRQWADAGRPDLPQWALTAPAVYTTMGLIPLGDLGEALRIQVLRGYETQLRQGGRISPSQVKAAIPAPVGSSAPGVRLRPVARRRHRGARRQRATPPLPVPPLLDAEGPPTPQAAAAPHRRRGDHPTAGLPPSGIPAVVRRRRAAALAAAPAVPHTAAVAREQVR